jgi:hypothetical protein
LKWHPSSIYYDFDFDFDGDFDLGLELSAAQNGTVVCDGLFRGLTLNAVWDM